MNLNGKKKKDRIDDSEMLDPVKQVLDPSEVPRLLRHALALNMSIHQL